jgi:primary-amine oxidase
VFNDAAESDVRVGATGIDSIKGVATRTMTDSTAASDTRYGTLVAPNLVAVNHDHYFTSISASTSTSTAPGTASTGTPTGR